VKVHQESELDNKKEETKQSAKKEQRKLEAPAKVIGCPQRKPESKHVNDRLQPSGCRI
jgi:hypothetical protein